MRMSVRTGATFGEHPSVEGRAKELRAGAVPVRRSLADRDLIGRAAAHGPGSCTGHGPRLLLADEPTGHQDAVWGRGVLRTLRRACAQGATCLVATNNEEILQYVDRILAIRDGEIHEEQTSESRTGDAQ